MSHLLRPPVAPAAAAAAVALAAAVWWRTRAKSVRQYMPTVAVGLIALIRAATARTDCSIVSGDGCEGQPVPVVIMPP